MPKGKSRALNYPLAPGFPEFKERLESLPGVNARVIVLGAKFVKGGRRRLNYQPSNGGVICSYVAGSSLINFKIICPEIPKLLEILSQIDQELRTGTKVS